MSSLFTTPVMRAWLGTGLAGALLLVACGGGGDGPQISNISAANARYTGTVTLTVSGARLDEGIAMSIEGPCETLTTVLGGSSDTRQFTCDVTAIGDFIATVARSDGGVIGRLTVNVPRPRVEVTTNLGNFVVELDPEKAPATTVNFLGYVNANFYTSVLVHGADPARGILAGGYRTGLRAKLPELDAIRPGVEHRPEEPAWHASPWPAVEGQPNSATHRVVHQHGRTTRASIGLTTRTRAMPYSAPWSAGSTVVDSHQRRTDQGGCGHRIVTNAPVTVSPDVTDATQTR
jgi:hypothetical protein